MTAAYDSPEQHLADQLELIRLVLAATEAPPAAGDEATDDRLAQLRAREAAIAARVAASPPALLPLERLRETFELSPTEVRVLVALTAFELDTSLRNAARRLMGDPLRVHPDVGLLGELIYRGRDRRRIAAELGPQGRLARFALVRLDRLADTPFALRRARVTERVIDLLHGRDVLDPDVARHGQLLPPVAPDALVLEAARLADVVALFEAATEAARDGRAHPAVILSGPEGSGRTSLATAAASALGLRVLRIRCAGLPRDEASLRAFGPAIVREVILWRAVLVLEALDQLAPDLSASTLDELLLAELAGPIAATVGRITERPPKLARGSVILELGVPAEGARAELWRRALGEEVAPDVSRWAAERYTITPGVLARAAESARARAVARGRTGGDPTVRAPDIHDGLRAALDAKLGTLGTRISWQQRWDDLILPEDSVAEVREFIARVRHRRAVYDDWGFGRKVAKGMGLSALFAGPPGTGKTMVAGLIAADLQLDLYQVDLSKVLSKWIGETEKNLAGLFEAAESGHAILLFDEADSLFAKRTQVQSSNDRYANLEVNYLLQRMEAFAGITILTTNNDTAIDEAFKRRLSLKIDFPVPESDERARLWRVMLPAEAAVGPDLDFEVLAERFEMTGGYIKNAVVRAAFLAADEGSPIAMRHLTRAARAEYQGMGKIAAHL